ncbi:CatA-like O-acetyltransferase [Harryflintia acetispora]|uniref:Chloramphenicol O-acetyltransferase type A n=1 Tax=Harryflintia acetispora TaxID=1849041 RepID=A0A9X8UKQ7_9FIRM|nr:CatA-like O-acetyltransferase [Harryflintia acetispora]TCL44449.1 chloramphenicol O-acetyltransferase type A [Harryflintia acetispora]
MAFQTIDYERWERREIYEAFHRTGIYVTVQMDITELRAALEKRGLRLYPALIYCVCRVVNSHEEYRYGYDENHNIGIWDVLHPFYTLPRRDNGELFSMKYTEYAPDFTEFYRRFLEDSERGETCGRLICDEVLPKNIVGISAMPGARFSSFQFFGDQKEDLTPFVVFGKFYREGERTLIPVSGEFSHGVSDGVQISRFFEGLEDCAARLLE